MKYEVLYGGKVIGQFDDYDKAEQLCIKEGAELYENGEFLASFAGCVCPPYAPFQGEDINSLTEDLINEQRC